MTIVVKLLTFALVFISIDSIMYLSQNQSQGLHPKPSTLNPKLSTLNPKNLKPSTLNPKP